MDRPALPALLTRFIGRQRDLAALPPLLCQSRLVTLTGTGGVGKTRLALEVIATVASQFPNGVWFVELESVADPLRVPAVVSAALRAGEEAGRPPVATLAGHIGGRSTLVVLDNCEHVIDAATALVVALLHACPRLHILATSRERLRVTGEQVWQVAPLAVSTEADAPTLSEAGQLFVERAALVRPGFQEDDQNRQAIMRLCRELDGLPLAIELAAARLGSLTIPDLADRLHDRFNLLSIGDRTVAARHQTLRSVVDWSYRLLNDAEQRCWQHFAVFEGGWSLEAAEAILSPSEAASHGMQALSSLVEKSLVVATQHDGRTRYRMLETLRRYALEQLRLAGQQDEASDRHYAWCVAFAEDTAGGLLGGSDQQDRLDRLDVEHANIVAALDWSATSGGNAGVLRLAAALWPFWLLRGYHREGRQWLERALEPDGLQPDMERRFKALVGLASLCWADGQPERAGALAQEAMAVDRVRCDPRDVIIVLNILGSFHRLQNDFAAARRCFQEILSIGEAARSPVVRSIGLRYLGDLARREGDLAEAQRQLDESLAQSEQAGYQQGAGLCYAALGALAVARGALEEAVTLLRKGLATQWAMGDRFDAVVTIDWLALCAAMQEQPGRALRLFGAAAALRDGLGSSLRLDLPDGYQRAIEQLRNAQGEARFAQWWTEGAALIPAHLMPYALGEDDPFTVPVPASDPATHPTPTGHSEASLRFPSPPTAPAEPLTPQERRVAALLARGLTNRQIAAELTVSTATAAYHVQNILTKLGFHRRAQIAAWAAQQGLAGVTSVAKLLRTS